MIFQYLSLVDRLYNNLYPYAKQHRRRITVLFTQVFHETDSRAQVHMVRNNNTVHGPKYPFNNVGKCTNRDFDNIIIIYVTMPQNIIQAIYMYNIYKYYKIRLYSKNYYFFERMLAIITKHI